MNVKFRQVRHPQNNPEAFILTQRSARTHWAPSGSVAMSVAGCQPADGASELGMGNCRSGLRSTEFVRERQCEPRDTDHYRIPQDVVVHLAVVMRY